MNLGAHPVSRRTTILLLFLGIVRSTASAAPSGNIWNKIRYQGGTIDAKVNPFDWNTTLTATPGEIELVFAGRNRVRIAVPDVLNVSYGQKAYRRVADMALLSVLATPIALFGLLHKSKDHLVAIQFRTGPNQTGAVLLTVHKDQYQSLLETLRTVTGKPIENWP